MPVQLSEEVKAQIEELTAYTKQGLLLDVKCWYNGYDMLFVAWATMIGGRDFYFIRDSREAVLEKVLDICEIYDRVFKERRLAK